MNYPVFFPGDGLSRPKGPREHHGIALTEALVLEIVPNSIPRLVSLDVFAAGKPVTIHRSSDNERTAILARAWRAYTNAKEYRYLTNNCQHLKNYVLTGNAYSEDVRSLFLLLLLGVCIYVAKRSS